MEKDTLTGTVERITYYNDENGYGVVKVMPDKRMPKYSARDGLITVVGTMPELGVGESAEFTGEWIENPRYGLQMQIETVTPIAPTSEQGITRYLSSGIVPGIGPVTAEKIVKHFGIDTINVLNHEPQRLHEVPTLKTALADKLAEAWKENQAVRQTMIFLQGYGVTAKMANKIHATYGAATINQVKEDPYALADDIFGIGFQKADQIARAMGLEMDAPQRLRAGLIYALKRLSQDGHTFSPRALLLETAQELLQIDDLKLIEDNLQFQILADNLKVDALTIDGEEMEAIYLPMFYYAEKTAAENLRKLANFRNMMRVENDDDDPQWDAFFSTKKEWHEVKLSRQQRDAVVAALQNKVSVLTGGPGTGKTTTLKMVIATLEHDDYIYALASPTGRAAKRLAEATGREAMTIHRLLGFTAAGDFEFDEYSKLELEMLIVDEASMIDLMLFHQMLKAIPESASLMLVGDVDQLPSVGAGNVLHDVINSGIAHVTQLDTIFRQSDDSHIIVNAHRINEGKSPFMDNKSRDFYFFGAEDPYEASELVVDIVKNRIPEKFGFDPIEDVQVIAPMYRSPVGIDALNEKLQYALNNSARRAEKKFGDRIFRVGDKVMQTRNNYEKEVFNGDIGRIQEIDDNANLMTVVYDGSRYVYYEFNTIVENLMHAFCISTHRSQGSEYPVVVMPIMKQHYMMLQRNLLYTAITRAKQMVVLVGQRYAVKMAVENNKVAERYSGLLPRLKEHKRRR